MTDPGLNQRLKQRSRRSGLMIGFSMALTLMVCVGAFTMIYAQLEPVVSDFVGRGDIEAPTPLPTQPPVAQEAAAPTAPPAPAATTAPTADAENVEPEATEEPTPDPDEFTPDYQITGDGPVNLRPGPGVASGAPIIALPLGTPLQYMDEEEPTSDPDGDDLSQGSVWMRFRTEDGEEGWIRQVDVEEYVP